MNPKDLQNDKDFMAASPEDQAKYLHESDPAFHAASPEDQDAYLAHVTGRKGAGLPPPAAGVSPKGTLPNGGDTGEGPIAQGLTTFETKLANTPRAIAKLANSKYWPVIDAKNYSELGRDLKSMNPIATDEGSLPMNIGATAANLLPFAEGAGEVAETTPFGRIAKTAGKTVANTSIERPLQMVSKIPDYWRSTSAEGRMLDATKQAVREGRAARIPTRIPKEAAPVAPLDQAIAEGRANALPTKIKPMEPGASSRLIVRPGALPKIGATENIPVRPGEVPEIGATQKIPVKPGFDTPHVGQQEIIPVRPGMKSFGPEEGSEAGEGISYVPEPRDLFNGEQPNYMASVPRKELTGLAKMRKPGAGTQLQQLGEPIIYIPKEADLPRTNR